MRETELWTRLRALLGDAYAPVWADSVVHADLGGRTVTQALTDGLAVRRIWLAACQNLDVPESLR
ncbi:MAG: DUF3046 domain-containing protein [Propionibacteriaceae bacterium]|nr:DUF3046 domain-containing protein [Propionibacteriaceae bacterium]